MSLITQCPACSTLFKVVPDQLRVSQGWVRCGQCDEVFDANAHMRKLPQQSAPEPATEPLPDQPLTAAPEPAHEPPQSGAQESSSYDWDGVLDDGKAPRLPEAVVDAFLEKSPQELIATSQPDPPLSIYPQSQDLPSDLNEGSLPPPDFAVPVSFMVAKPKVAPRSVRARVGWIATLVLLLVAALLQLIVHERERLAAAHPALKQALVALCEPLRCEVNALKQIESVVIDSSTFSKVQADIYKLSVTLKNTAAIDVAKPSLELTLTDSQDQPLLRKVITPSDLGDTRAVIGQADEVHWTIALAVKRIAGATPVAGYRVLAFYP